MSELILLDGEFRSLLRNGFERLIGTQIPKKENKYVDAANKLSIRVLASLLGIYLFGQLIAIPNLKEYVTYFFLGLFVFINFFME